MKEKRVAKRKDAVSKKTPETLTPEQYTARFNAEKAKLQRAYCTMFKFWRTCRFKPCRKARACRGDQDACLKRGEKLVPRDIQWEARRQMLAATPANAGPPERMAREFLPGSFYV